MRPSGHRTSAVLPGALVVASVVATLVGCGSVEPVAPHAGPIIDPKQLYTRLVLDHPAANLLTAEGYNTLQLTATPLDALGVPMVGLPAPTYRTLDTTAIDVTADGRVTALMAGTELSVIAELTVGPVRHVDTTRVTIRSMVTPPTLTSLSIDPTPPDSGLWPLVLDGTYPQGVVNAAGVFAATHFKLPTAATGIDAQDLLIEYTSLDPAIATIERWTGIVQPRRPGHVRLVARTLAYGVAKTATATFTVAPPLFREVLIRPGAAGPQSFVASVGGGFESNEVRIPPNGMVFWLSLVGNPVDVTFDDHTGVTTPMPAICDFLAQAVGPDPFCGDGDIVVPAHPDPSDPYGNFGFNFFLTMRIRQFQTPGIYTYRSMQTGATGRVVVTTDFD